MSSNEEHNIDESWKVPLYLMSGVVVGVTLTAIVTLTFMGAFSADTSASTQPEPPAATAVATPGGAP